MKNFFDPQPDLQVAHQQTPPPLRTPKPPPPPPAPDGTNIFTKVLEAIFFLDDVSVDLFGFDPAK